MSAPTGPVKQPYPYEHAPRLEAQGPVVLSSLVEQQSGDLEIEIGPGRGSFLIERATECPEARVVGLEIRWKWATLVDERLHRDGLSFRARVYAEDARAVLPRFEPDACVASFFIHFPDPWWKARQKKRLVIGKPVVDQIARLLRPSGMLFVQTDVTDRGEAYETLLQAHEAFVPDGEQPGRARMSCSPWGARGNREKRAEQDGIPVIRLRYRKKG